MSAVIPGIVPCGHCGAHHPSQPCPRIAAIEYHENGNVKRVEYRDPISGGFVGRERFWEGGESRDTFGNYWRGNSFGVSKATP
tara:strand:+ start:30345 stop:30593 length:249 start_codon:yes stop_codon:yes gene_type:complete